MPTPLIDCDIPVTGAVAMMFLDAGLKPITLYRNGSIPAEVVLTVKGSDKAFIGRTVVEVIEKAESAIYGGL